MNDGAIILTDPGLPAADGNVAKVLRFFGVPCRTLTAAEFLAGVSPDPSAPARPVLFCSAEVFRGLIRGINQLPGGMPGLGRHVHSAFVYAGNDSGALQEVARILSGDEGVLLSELGSHDINLTVSDRLNEFCGVMAGLQIAASRTDMAASFAISTSRPEVTNIISTDRGAVFLKTDFQKATVFLSAGRDIIDMDAELTARNFDIRNHFLSTIPIVLLIKWAFAGMCWDDSGTDACLVIDDPLLKPTYGFVRFDELLSLMKSHRFSSNIAFIPWNWSRSSPRVTRLFRENPEQLSLSVHGCDHIAEEFGSRDGDALAWRAKTATERMRRHEAKTGIHHDRIMVFPQGVFSDTAPGVLKQNDFIAAVNTEVFSVDPEPRKITTSAFWDVAVMDYSCFPIFTRRYPAQGVENFAFDILLGKPCIIVIHHDFCRGNCKQLIEFIDRLNALNRPITWRSLGEVVRRSCRQRELPSGEMEIEMYGAELRIENRSERKKRFCIRRRETTPSTVKEILAGLRPVPWNSFEGHISFEIELNPGQTEMVSIKFHTLAANGQLPVNVGYRVKTMLRRYLSEVRDNYVTRYKPLFGSRSSPSHP